MSDKLLRKTRNVLRDRGWYQGDYSEGGNKAGPLCLVGGLNVAATGDPVGSDHRNPEYNEALIGLAKAIDEGMTLDALDYSDEYDRFESVEGIITDWNDTKGRTIKEVESLFDQVLQTNQTKGN